MRSKSNTVSLLLGVGRILKARMHEELPLSFTLIETLKLLATHEHVTMRGIATHFNITAPSATAIVRDLVARHLVVRVENKQDRREVVLHLTAHGTALLNDIEKKRAKVFASVLSVLTPEDREELDNVLQKIVTHHTA